MDQDLEFIHREIEDLSWHLHRVRGVFSRLNREIENGRWIHPETTEAIRLRVDAETLRGIADELLRKRNALVAQMPQLTEAAE